MSENVSVTPAVVISSDHKELSFSHICSVEIRDTFEISWNLSTQLISHFIIEKIADGLQCICIQTAKVQLHPLSYENPIAAGYLQPASVFR